MWVSPPAEIHGVRAQHAAASAEAKLNRSALRFGAEDQMARLAVRDVAADQPLSIGVEHERLASAHRETQRFAEVGRGRGHDLDLPLDRAAVEQDLVTPLSLLDEAKQVACERRGARRLGGQQVLLLGRITSDIEEQRLGLGQQALDVLEARSPYAVDRVPGADLLGIEGGTCWDRVSRDGPGQVQSLESSGHRQARKPQQCWPEVEVTDGGLHPPPALGRPGQLQDPGDAEQRVEHGVPVAVVAMLAELLAVIGRDHDQGVVVEAEPLQLAHQHPDLVIVSEQFAVVEVEGRAAAGTGKGPVVGRLRAVWKVEV